MLGLPVYHPEDRKAGECKAAFMAVGSATERRKFVVRLSSLNLPWETFYDRRSHVSRMADIGKGSLILPFATIGPGTSVGCFAYVGVYASIGTKARLGDFVSLLPRASAGGCTVGSDCTIGFNSACLDGAALGDAVTIAPYTWVRKSVPSCSFVAGTPARITKLGASQSEGME